MQNPIGHIPGPRETKNLKPFLLIVSGLSGVGKSTLSKTLTETNSFIYYSTYQFTLDPNLPIEELNRKINKKDAKHGILHLRNIVYKNQNIFIDHCYNEIIKHKTNTVIDGIYFTNNDFLKHFKFKFNNDYRIWLLT